MQVERFVVSANSELSYMHPSPRFELRIYLYDEYELVELRSSESYGMFCRVLNLMSTHVSEVSTASIVALMMEAARPSETSVDIQLRTRQYTPEDSELHTRRCDTLNLT
jgi:hypothetical protein